MTGWDCNAGVRERLSLLALLGPGVKLEAWGYHPSKDYWYFCGAEGKQHIVKGLMPVSEALQLIATRWKMTEGAAFKFIEMEKS